MGQTLLGHTPLTWSIPFKYLRQLQSLSPSALIISHNQHKAG